jgi:phospholipid/cholesterol/gamma-HCH transport system substrate-binding protein
MEIMLGLFVLVGLIILGGLIILFGQVLELSQGTYEVTAYFDKVTGLKPGTPVRLLGIDVGQVKDLRIRPGGDGVELTLLIHEDVNIPFDAKLTVLTEGLLGDNYLEFSSGTGEPISHAGDAVIQGEAYMSPQEYLQDAVSGLKGTAEAYEDLARNLNKRLTDEEFFGHLKEAARTAPEMMTSFKNTSDELQTLARKLNAEAEDLSAGLKRLTGKVEGQIEHQGSNLDDLTAGLGQSIDSLNKTPAELHEITESVRKGEGTVGGLMMRDEIYQQMLTTLERTERTMSELEETVKFIREHPDAFIWGR